ncbi:PEP-CTERM sorting domain-containing protein [Mariniblastus fucicola]|uniref:Ice-binding protein C-terminal domain-containing protein n=1 Tax=Mariniblastus fucicola TaxID=980251 RepID=A0A5B9P8Y7_9BACT|nr:PEP-CTERM sorting domain-containing protein [Mariniblastus fucicola]QEG21350.1 hypothetical protein MFFC18_12060 [Mariniblastus fucicola]
MKKFIWALALCFACANFAQADLVISQYVETDSGTTPKGVELWNSGPAAIDFSVTSLDILKGTNGGALSSDFVLSTGVMAVGEVIVVGTADIGTYLTGEGLGAVQFFEESFTFNGDDALQIQLGGAIQDTFGVPGSDPGTSWDGSSVSTRNQNIELRVGITTGDTDGFTDPSIRFSTVSTAPSAAGGLAGFGLVAAVPEPTTAVLFGLAGLGLCVVRRRS